MRTGFVILHYINVTDTVNCINSINGIKSKDDVIVVVDNASPNGSGKEVFETYNTQEGIEVILLENNVGFANGNNAGYKILKENYDLDMMVVLNNDTVIEQKDFLNLIEQSYKKNNWQVMGPDIITIVEEHQNPLREKMQTEAQITKRLNKLYIYRNYYNIKKVLKLNWFNLLEWMIDKRGKTTVIDRSFYREDVVLHGACIMIDRKFIENEEYMFNQNTFMYGEEALLALQCQNKGYKVAYDPSIKISHLEGASTKAMSSNSLDKNIFVTKYQIEGAELLLKNIQNR